MYEDGVGGTDTLRFVIVPAAVVGRLDADSSESYVSNVDIDASKLVDKPTAVVERSSGRGCIATVS